MTVKPVQFESRDGHLRAQMQSDGQGREELFVYDHRGNLLDVLSKVEGLAPAAPTTVLNGCPPQPEYRMPAQRGIRAQATAKAGMSDRGPRLSRRLLTPPTSNHDNKPSNQGTHHEMRLLQFRPHAQDF